MTGNPRQRDCFQCPQVRVYVSISGREQNCWHFADYILKCIFLNENSCILIRFSLFLTVPLIKSKTQSVMILPRYLTLWANLSTHNRLCLWTLFFFERCLYLDSYFISYFTDRSAVIIQWPTETRQSVIIRLILKAGHWQANISAQSEPKIYRPLFHDKGTICWLVESQELFMKQSLILIAGGCYDTRETHDAIKT